MYLEASVSRQQWCPVENIPGGVIRSTFMQVLRLANIPIYARRRKEEVGIEGELRRSFVQLLLNFDQG